MAGIEEDAEERVAEVAVDDLLEHASHLADVQRLVPLGHGGEVGHDEPLDVVVDPCGQLRRLLDDEACPAVECAPDAEGRRQRIAALDATIARAQQPEASTRSGRQHEVAGQRGAVPLEQPHGFAFGHPRP